MIKMLIILFYYINLILAFSLEISHKGISYSDLDCYKTPLDCMSYYMNTAIDDFTSESDKCAHLIRVFAVLGVLLSCIFFISIFICGLYKCCCGTKVIYRNLP